jgi:hypothetical protein
MTWLPSPSADVVKEAVPPESEETPSTLAPSRKLTFPDGVPPVPVTVAVNVTAWPGWEGFSEESSVVVVGWAPERLVKTTSLPSPPT